MKNIYVSLRIIALFSIAILMSFLPDYYPLFFGDYSCNIINLSHGFNGREYDIHSHWGYRHYLYFYMGVCLFILQVVDIINYISYKNYGK